MSRSLLRWIAAGLGIAIVAGLVTILITDEDGGGETTTSGPERQLGASGDQVGESGGEADQERVVKRVAKRYVLALNDRDGARACELLGPGAIDEVELPRERGGCAASLEASIGFRDPRGLPVFRDSRITRIEGVEVSGDAARVTAAMVTRFADRDEPSVEDDVIYLTRNGDRWSIAKPSAALYRSIGTEPPPQAISPP